MALFETSCSGPITMKLNCNNKNANLSRKRDRLPDLGQHLAKPGGSKIEGPAALDAIELDGAQDPAACLIMSDDPGAAGERAVDSEIDHALDEPQVFAVGGRRAGEIA